MSKYNPNSLAFPRVVPDGAEWADGMDLRTYLAGQALAGYMATIEPRADTNPFSEPQHAAALGALCVRCADAVIDALNLPPPEKPLKKPVKTPTVQAPVLKPDDDEALQEVTEPPAQKSVAEAAPEFPEIR